MTSKPMINEIVGVPRNIHQTSELLYRKLYEYYLDRLPNKEIPIDRFPSKIFLSLYSTIGEKKKVKISSIYVIVNVDNVIDGESTSLNMGVKSTIIYSNKTNKTQINPFDEDNKVNLSIDILIPYKLTRFNIIEYFIENKDQLISTLSHELKHVYHNSLKSKDNITNIAKYNTTQQLMNWINQETISTIMFNTYFVSESEMITRNTEVMSLLLNANIKTKQQFLQFMLSNQTVIRLKSIINTDYDSFYNSLSNDYENIKNIMNINDKNYEKNFVLERFLTRIKKEFINRVAEFYLNFTEGPFYLIIKELDPDFQTTSSIFITNYLKKYANSSTKDFYTGLIENNKRMAEKTLRKIYKLYSIINQDKQ